MESRKVWRPPKFETKEQLMELINAYLANTEIDSLSLTGLCLACWTNKETLSDYEKKDWFSEIVKEAKLYIENSYELSLRKNGRTWDIFALKNFWWKDKIENDNTNTNLDISDSLTQEQKEKIANQYK
jgi:hypothetical protein